MKTEDMNTKRTRLGFALIAMAGLSTGLAHANPSEDDATIAAGTAIFDSNGNLLTITTSDMTIIDWLAFNIDFGETVQFIMPDATSRVLNRIDGATPSEINGTLLANGQVFLVNPSGIVFGENAVVNAGSLYAAAGHISNANFISETYRFTDMQGAVVNRGHLGGDVIALLGGQVANMGTISAPEGTVIMAAGEQVLIGTHLGSRFVEIEVPLQETESAFDQNFAEAAGIPLAAGDVYSIAAWNTGTITADHVFIKAEGGDVALAGSINANGAGDDGFLTVRGDNVIVADTLEARGTPITAGTITLTAGPSGVIDLGADLNSTNAGIFLHGDVRLTDSVSLTNTGTFSNTNIVGDLYSEAGEYNTLSISANNGRAFFGGSVGDSATSDQRLGFLDVDVNLTSYMDNVSTLNGMTLMGYTEIMGPSVTFHTGLGTALFGGNIYSHIDGVSDVAFMYDGDVWNGVGEARTPFKFQGSIGIAPPLHFMPNQGAFRTIRFGDDAAGAAMVSSAFLFSNAAEAGLDLMDAGAIDLTSQFFVAAREGVYAGRGQKITSMGSIQFAAKGHGFTTVELSDVNVIGDLSVLSQGRLGGEITLLGHLGGYIDGVANEADRSGGGYDEQAAELIASGNIRLDGMLNTDTAGAMLGASSVVLANNGGMGMPLGLTVETFPGGVSLANFMGTESGTTGLAYAYDLTLGDFVTFGPPTTPANLATAFADEDVLVLRDDDPYLAQRQVLTELGLSPVDPSDEVNLEGAINGVEHYDFARTESLIIERVSPRSVSRMVDAYIALFGERDESTGTRPGFDSIAQGLATGDEDQVDMLMSKIGLVLDRIALLELTPLEIQRAQNNLLNLVRPDSMDPDQFRSQWAKN
jgi:filamentous hemagglutinin family protein